MSGRSVRNQAFNTDEQDHMRGGHEPGSWIRFSSLSVCALWSVVSPFGPQWKRKGFLKGVTYKVVLLGFPESSHLGRTSCNNLDRT